MQRGKKPEALIESIKAVQEMNCSLGVKSDIQVRVLTALEQAVYSFARRISFRASTAKLAFVTFSPNSQLVATASEDNTIRIWQKNGSLKAVLIGHTHQIIDVTFSPDSQSLVVVGDDNTVKVWQVDGKLIQVFKEKIRPLKKANVKEKNQINASVLGKENVKISNPNGILMSMFKHPSQVTNISFSPDRQILVSASADNMVRLWKVDGTLLKTLKGHKSAVQSASFSPDGRAIASASADGTVILWNLNVEDLLIHGCNLTRNSLQVTSVLQKAIATCATVL